jgi:hypothetical protein
VYYNNNIHTYLAEDGTVWDSDRRITNERELLGHIAGYIDERIQSNEDTTKKDNEHSDI